MNFVNWVYEHRMRRLFNRLHSALGDISINGGHEEAYKMRCLLAEWFNRVMR